MALDEESLGRVKASVDWTEQVRKGDGTGPRAIGGRAQPITLVGVPVASISSGATGAVIPQVWGSGLDTDDVTYPAAAEVQVLNKSGATLVTTTWYIFLWAAGAYVPIFTPNCPEGS